MKNAVCTITGKPCRCSDGGGCNREKHRTALDGASPEMVRALRTAHGQLQGIIYMLEEATEMGLLDRCYPKPEVRTELRTLQGVSARLRKYAEG